MTEQHELLALDTESALEVIEAVILGTDKGKLMIEDPDGAKEMGGDGEERPKTIHWNPTGSIAQADRLIDVLRGRFGCTIVVETGRQGVTTCVTRRANPLIAGAAPSDWESFQFTRPHSITEACVKAVRELKER